MNYLTLGSLSKVFGDQGSKVMFANLFDELAEHFPKDQMIRLQDLIYNSNKVENWKSLRKLDQATFARACFRVLRDEELFTYENVIFVQYLLKTTHCEELYTQCVEYAKTQKALCFYEAPTENGYKNVKFHVGGNVSDYTTDDIKKIKETVAVILKCTEDDIIMSGIYQATSVYVVISIKQEYKRKLISMVTSDKEKLIGLNIDYFIVDFKTVYLGIPKKTSVPETKEILSIDEEKKMRLVTRVRELFHGQFNKQEIMHLLETHGWNQKEAVNFVLKSEPHVVNLLLCGKSERDIIGLQRNVELRLNAERDNIPNQKRQFACDACDNVWWRRVPRHKPVSKCDRCHRIFDPIPEDEEYGWATFRCDCGIEFSGYGQVNITRSECYNCHSMALAVSIRPPERRKYRRTRSFHGWSSFESSEWDTGSEPRCQIKKHQKNIVKRLESGFELDHMPTYKEYHGPVSVNDINEEYIPSTTGDRHSSQASGKRRVIVPSLLHGSSSTSVDCFMLNDD